MFSALMVCILTSCTNENGGESMNPNELSNVDHPLSSYSNNYEAVIEKFYDNGVRNYKLFIVDVNDNGAKYEADLVFRARDRNYVFWADAEDVLWGYSGDVGTFFWTKEDGSWVKKAYADNKDAIVPQALKEARPNK
jgi:hypothetical protein